MLSSGFVNTPITRSLILSLISASLVASIADLKHLLPIQPTPHLYPYLQFWRLCTWQIAYTSSTDLLFATLLLYQFRVLERLWGSRKFTSFLCVSAIWTGLLAPALLSTVVRLVSWGRWNYLPGGMTGVVFAALAVWREEVPRLYRYKIVTGSPDPRSGSNDTPGVILSDKTTTYVMAAQLALSQFPYSLLAASVGWIVGLAWGGDLLPGRMNAWRIPRWLLGDFGAKSAAERERYEGLRRRLEEEGGRSDGMRASGVDGMIDAVDGEARRRPMMRQVADYFRGAF
jgi:membrane associated rhomboid family serine protease